VLVVLVAARMPGWAALAGSPAPPGHNRGRLTAVRTCSAPPGAARGGRSGWRCGASQVGARPLRAGRPRRGPTVRRLRCRGIRRLLRGRRSRCRGWCRGGRRAARCCRAWRVRGTTRSCAGS